MTLKKQDNSLVKVTLKRTKQDSQDNVVNSYILKGDKSVGYIALPSFYTDFQGFEANGCANDLGKELFKLKRSGIEGLIVDLRYNGGGSIKEALQLVGIFVDEGTIGLVKEADDSVRSLKDPSRGVAYDGPLVILVNNYSASASELFSVALKDYNRALIVGDTTYGKATGQSIFPLGYPRGTLDLPEETNFLKTTIFKLYRIDGMSIQGTGLIPDITIPSPYDFIRSQENQLPNYIVADEVYKEVFTKKYPSRDLSSLPELQKVRESSDNYFNDLYETQKLLQSSAEIPLGVETFFDAMEEQKAVYDKMRELLDYKSDAYNVINNSYDEDVISFDPIKKEENDRILEDLQSDKTLNETFLITQDYIKLLTN